MDFIYRAIGADTAYEDEWRIVGAASSPPAADCPDTQSNMGSAFWSREGA